MDIFAAVTPEIKEKFLPLAKNVASELAIGDNKQVLAVIQQALGQAYVLGTVEAGERLSAERGRANERNDSYN